MDIKSAAVTQNNVCLCCLSADCYKDISTEEVYKDMLKETLGIEVVTKEPKQHQPICEKCIRKLQEASKFKQTVIKSIYYLANLPEVVLNDEMMEGEESIKCDDEIDNCMDEDEVLANLKLVMSKVDNNEAFNGRCPIKRRRKSRIKKQKLENDPIEAPTKNDKDWSKIVERRGNGPILRQNSLELISNSTLCVFQWNKSRYRCFCCKEPFSDVNLLRDHTHAHKIEEIEKKIIAQQNRLVKVEVSVLFCKICSNEMENLKDLRSHLSYVHDIKFESNEDLLVPFKIGDVLKCQLCSETFTVFRLLNIHMNLHYQKQVCHICGAGFSNLVFLNLHKTRSHRPLSCKLCDLVFKKKTDKKEHDIVVHDVKFERKLRFPCPYCEQRFFQENFRVQHLVETHGMIKPEHKCQMCSKVFITKSLLNNHVKNVHLKEKIHECEICHHFFYTKSDVARHKVTHTGDKRHSCTFCDSLFATKDSLRRHLKRTHVGVN